MSGTIVVSLDAELMWGFHYMLDRVPPELHLARQAYPSILDLFEKWEVPATWAFVGHLFLDECDGQHKNVVAVNNHWFDADPGGNLGSHPLWYGRDLVESVASSSVGHEIGCHTFSHAQFVNRRVAISELLECKELADEMGLELVSLVFPENVIRHLDAVRETGFSCFRDSGDEVSLLPHTCVPSFMRFYLHRQLPFVCQSVTEQGGVWAIQSSMRLFRHPRLVESGVRILSSGRDPLVSLARKGIEAAIRRCGIFHIRFHPWEVVTNFRRVRLEKILEIIKDNRDKDLVRVITMGNLAKEMSKGF